MREIACFRQLTPGVRHIQCRSMAFLILPEKVVLRLVDSAASPVRVANVLFRVHTFSTRKNDFKLAPFVTNREGVATIRKAELLAEAAAHYDSGLMDFDRIETCQPVVEIAPMDPSEIERALKARTDVWKNLLQGEIERWTSIEELRDVYRNAANGRVSLKSFRACWDGSETEVEYSLPAVLR
jgi:hypothetical protein